MGWDGMGWMGWGGSVSCNGYIAIIMNMHFLFISDVVGVVL